MSLSQIKLNRIKNKIDMFTNTFKNGKFSILVNLFVSFMVTLEFSNGIEKMDIQFVLHDFLKRLHKLETYYKELHNGVISGVISGVTSLDTKDNKSEEKEFDIFREKVYKLFDLGDILKMVLDKCVILGKAVPVEYLKPYTKMMIDNLISTDTDKEFDDKIIEYIIDRVGKDKVKEYLESLIKKC